MLGPRVVVAGVSSGVGKTTVATGLLAALRHAGLRVAGAKVGPDFIDPGYHALASGTPPRNLDPWLCNAASVLSLAGRAAAGADILVVEGVMGLFDGAGDGTASSTADIATLLDAPVLLVVDAAAMSGSVAAMVRGYRDHDPRINVAGIVLNRVGSAGHEQLLRDALVPLDIPVIGVLRRDEALLWRDRHLGLVPVAEHPDAVRRSLATLGERVREGFDLDAVVRIAGQAPLAWSEPVRLPDHIGRCRVGVAAGSAFTFAYRDNLEALEAAGAELVPFDPLTDHRLPEAIDGLLVGGGFPEVYGEALAANGALLADARNRIRAGLPTWAECGGLLWLADELDGRPMAGVVPTTARLGDRLNLGYRHTRLLVDTPIGAAGTELRGHEFHYSTCDPSGDAVHLRGRFGEGVAGFAGPNLFATYVHVHAGGDPMLFETFVRSCTTHHSPSFDAYEGNRR
jgi:cobyrinic acid a,c-diamide synthase